MWQMLEYQRSTVPVCSDIVDNVLWPPVTAQVAVIYTASDTVHLAASLDRNALQAQFWLFGSATQLRVPALLR